MCKILNKKNMKTISGKYFHITSLLDNKLSDIIYLAMRLYVGKIFLTSGYQKFSYIINDQLDTLFFLFESYNVPLLPVNVASYLGTFSETIFGGLLILGLFSRFASIGLLGVTAMIFIADGNPHAPLWGLILLCILVKGGGFLSADHWLKKFFKKQGLI